MVFTAPGSKVKGPADCKNLLSAGRFPAVTSVHSCPGNIGSETPGNIKLQRSVVAPGPDPLPSPPKVIGTLSFQIPLR